MDLEEEEEDDDDRMTGRKWRRILWILITTMLHRTFLLIQSGSLLGFDRQCDTRQSQSVITRSEAP